MRSAPIAVNIRERFKPPLPARLLRSLLGGYQHVRGVPRVLYWLRHVAFPGETASIETPDGLLATIDPNDYGQLMLFYFSYCRDLQQLLRDILRPGDCCLDLGANVGLLSVVMADLVGPRGRVLSVDPNHAVIGQLRRTIELGGYNNIELLLAGVAARRGTGSVLRPRGAFSESVEIGSLDRGGDVPALADVIAAAEVVRLETVDTLMAAFAPKQVSFVKLDVEGEEAGLLLSMKGTLQKGTKPRLLVEFHPSKCERRGVSVQEVRDGLFAAGYSERVVYEHSNGYALVDRSGEPMGHEYAVRPMNVLYLGPEHIANCSGQFLKKWHSGCTH